MGPLLSQGASQGEQGKPFEYRGVRYGPIGLANAQWRVDRKGLNSLAEAGRLWSNVRGNVSEAGANQLHLKIYRSEMPGKRLTNHWGRTISPSDKRYPVQTGNLAIQRCILMTTKPGDLVLDPTGGGGTTALVAESWGRRWISIDSSRESISVTRERVLVHNYPAHFLLGSEEGFEKERSRRVAARQEPLLRRPEGARDPATGFVVDRMPYVSAATLAYAGREGKSPKRDITWLVDRPAGKKSGRVCSRFTVETELLEVYRRPEEMIRPSQARRDVQWQERIVQMLERTGVRSDSGQKWDLEGVQSILDRDTAVARPGMLRHKATLVHRQSGAKKTTVIAVWPEDAKVDVAAIHRNVREAIATHPRAVLLVVGAEFSEGTEPRGGGVLWAAEVMRVKANPEVHLEGVVDNANTSSMVLVAEPAVSVKRREDGQLQCTISGWNEFDPVTGTAKFRKAQNIRMWMLDTNYDGTQFCARRIHFPSSLRKKENQKILKSLLGREGSQERLHAAFDWVSHPFPEPKLGEIAVRVVTAGGGTMSWSGDVRDCK